MATAIDRGHAVAVMGEVVNEPDVNDKELKKAAERREHRRKQVRKAQTNHRDRKKDFIRELEREAAQLKDLVDLVNRQIQFLTIENSGMQTKLEHAKWQAQAGIPQPTPPITAGAYTSQVPLAVQPLDAIASVIMDPLLNERTLHLRQGNTIHSYPDGTVQVVAPGTKGQTALLNKPRPDASSQSPGVIVRRQYQSLTEEMHAAHLNEMVAIKATNFILATHFVPDLPSPCPGIPVPPDHVPSGHDMMASTEIYRHAPLGVFQTMWSGSPMLGPDAGEPIDHLTTKPWTVPISSASVELMKLYAMSTSLPWGEGEMTPVQVWFVLVQKLGLETLLDPRIFEGLKIKLGAHVRCFGFGTTITEMEVKKVVREVTGVELAL